MLAYRSLCPSGWTTRWDEQRGKWHAADGEAWLTSDRGGNFPPQTRPVDSDCVRDVERSGGGLENGIGAAEDMYHIDRQWQCSSGSRRFLFALMPVTCVDDKPEEYVGPFTRADKRISILPFIYLCWNCLHVQNFCH